MGDNKSSEAVSTSNGSPSYTSAARVIRFRQELRSNTINLVDVSKLAYEGVPDKYGLRPLVWKVSLLSPTQTAAGSTCNTSCTEFAAHKACVAACSCSEARFAMMQLLLAYLPVDTAAWPALLGKKRKAYAEFCEVRHLC